MRIFFSSDTHYFHGNIIKYCERPFSTVEEMNECMIDSWNSLISDEDIAFHVGDFSLSRSATPLAVAKIAGRLRGKKILIRGNHDQYDDSFFLSAGFKAVIESINLGGVLLVHYPLHEAFARKIDDSHWGSVSHVIHGHTHKKGTPEHDAHFNVAVDRHDFLPVSLEKAVPHDLHESFLNSLSSSIPTLF